MQTYELIPKQEIHPYIEKHFLPIQITDIALEKGNAIASSLDEVCSELGLPSMEVGMYMLSTHDEAQKPRPQVQDLYIGHYQNVTPNECVITGKGEIKSLLEFRKKFGMQSVGWAHSHGKHNNFFSDIDRDSLPRFLADTGLYTNVNIHNPLCELPVQQDGQTTYAEISPQVRIELPPTDQKTIIIAEHENLQVNYAYAAVFNAANETPFCCIAYKDNGQTYLVEEVPHEIIQTKASSITDVKNIRSQLITRLNNVKETYEERKSEADKKHARTPSLIDNLASRIDAYRNNPDDEVGLLESITTAKNAVIDYHQDDPIPELNENIHRVTDHFKQVVAMLNPLESTLEQRVIATAMQEEAGQLLRPQYVQQVKNAQIQILRFIKGVAS